MTTEHRMDEVDNFGKTEVKWCEKCRCKTWHFNGKCEWADGHDAKLIGSIGTGKKK